MKPILLAALMGIHLACAAPAAPRRALPPRVEPQPAPETDGPLRVGPCSVAIEPPAGWTLKLEAETVALLPTSGSSERIRIRIAPIASTTRSIFEEARARFRSRAGVLVISDAEPLRSSAGRPIHVRFLAGDSASPHEGIACVEEEAVIVVITLRAESKLAFDQALPAFESVLSSYAFVPWPAQPEPAIRQHHRASPTGEQPGGCP
ncbi:MAG: hypothetical protein JXR96_26345 [Deltaproteobacteria bacterium]|nr:hypothetical protein [Deltaproteobacteria bacterium]